MQRKMIKVTGLALIMILLVGAGISTAGDVRNRETIIGVKGGFIGSATYYVGSREFGSAMSYSIGTFLDYKLAPKILGGLSLDIHNVSDIYESNVFLLDLSATLKAMVFSPNSNLTFRPEFAIGYGNLGDFDFGSSSHLLLKGGTEVVISTAKNISWLGEIMLCGSVSGGNDDVEITFGPALLIRGGIIF